MQSMSEALSPDKIHQALARLTGWTFLGDKVTRQYQFSSFTEAISFITEMAFACEKANHHPELFNVYNRIELSLTTHDAGNQVTSKDLLLAEEIESIYARGR